MIEGNFSSRWEEVALALTPTLSPGRGGIAVSPTAGSVPNVVQGGDTELVTAFQAALDEDLNISAAWETINAVLGIGLPEEAEAPAELQALLVERQLARKNKDFKRSDEIRDQLKAQGWVIEDSPKGQRLKKL